MIVSFLNQKGGVGKSSLARSMAVEYVKHGWDVHIADMDTTQLTTLQWATKRAELGVQPEVDVAAYQTPKSAIKSAKRCDLLIIDGTPYASTNTLEIAKHSDLIIIPTGISSDDLEPSLVLGRELSIKLKIPKEKLLYVINQVPDNGGKEAISSRSSIIDWGFNATPGWIAKKTGYSQAMDVGYTMAETRYPSLNNKVANILEAIDSHLPEQAEA